MDAMQILELFIGPMTVIVPLLFMAYLVRRHPNLFQTGALAQAFLHSQEQITGVRRIIGYVSYAMFFVGLFMWLFFYSYYAATRPRHQEPGRDISLNDHGTVVYLTRQENALVWWPFDGAFLFGGLAGIFLLSASRRP